MPILLIWSFGLIFFDGDGDGGDGDGGGGGDCGASIPLLF